MRRGPYIAKKGQRASDFFGPEVIRIEEVEAGGEADAVAHSSPDLAAGGESRACGGGLSKERADLTAVGSRNDSGCGWQADTAANRQRMAGERGGGGGGRDCDGDDVVGGGGGAGAGVEVGR